MRQPPRRFGGPQGRATQSLGRIPRFLSLHFERLPEAEKRRRSEEFLTRISARRSVRDFSSDPVPFELVRNAIRAAASAPSGANRQPWRFVVISDPAVKREIRIAAEREEKESYERRMPEEWLEALAPLGTDWHKPYLAGSVAERSGPSDLSLHELQGLE